MMISAIYQKYQIMPSLQMHMYRVAGVADSICEVHPQISLQDRSHIISACLLHDMGNILKFNLELFPEFLEPEGLDYWQEVKESYAQKYETDEHLATLLIAKELNVSEETYRLIDSVGFSLAQQNFENKHVPTMICAYADMRVQPHGVTSMHKRLEDGKKRFDLRKIANGKEHFSEMVQYLHKIEGYIFSECPLTPEEITEASVQTRIPALQTMKVI